MQRLMSTFPDVPNKMLAVIAPLLYKKRNSNGFATWNGKKDLHESFSPSFSNFHQQARLLELSSILTLEVLLNGFFVASMFELQAT